MVDGLKNLFLFISYLCYWLFPFSGHISPRTWQRCSEVVTDLVPRLVTPQNLRVDSVFWVNYISKRMEYSDWLGLGHMLNSRIMGQLHPKCINSKSRASSFYRETSVRFYQKRGIETHRQKERVISLKKNHLLYSYILERQTSKN